MSPKKRIETVGDLIAELTKYPSEAKLNLRCREMHCCGHGEDEYCYCSEESVDKNIDYVCKEDIRVDNNLVIIQSTTY